MGSAGRSILRARRRPVRRHARQRFQGRREDVAHAAHRQARAGVHRQPGQPPPRNSAGAGPQDIRRKGHMQAPAIPAMTTDAEREFYYRIVSENAGKGAIVEFGAWLGASTAYIAAAIRDSGFATKAHVYDKFLSKPGHVRKVEEFYAKHDKQIPTGPSLQQFKDNLGPLLDYVEIHHGQIETMKWSGEPIAVLITDAPKRVPAISPVLTTLR